MHKAVWIFVLILGLNDSYAQTQAVAGAEPDQDIQLKREPEKLPPYSFSGLYSPIDLIMPSKMGASFAVRNDDQSKLWELEYLRASIALKVLSVDFGGITDERLSLVRRSFSKNGSFNWYWGPAYHSLKAVLGPDLLVGVPNPFQYDMLDVKTLGLQIGIGNRWPIRKNAFFMIDWVGWSQPLMILKKDAPYLESSASPSDRDNVNSALSWFAYMPRLYLFKLGLGINF